MIGGRQFEWHVHSDIARDGISLYAVSADRSERIEGQLHIKPHARGDWCEPTLVLDADQAQQIMNGLWHAGVRPKNGAGALAHVETLKAHLDDLRTIAWHALKIKS